MKWVPHMLKSISSAAGKCEFELKVESRTSTISSIRLWSFTWVIYFFEKTKIVELTTKTPWESETLLRTLKYNEDIDNDASVLVASFTASSVQGPIRDDFDIIDDFLGNYL